MQGNGADDYRNFIGHISLRMRPKLLCDPRCGGDPLSHSSDLCSHHRHPPIYQMPHSLSFSMRLFILQLSQHAQMLSMCAVTYNAKKANWLAEMPYS